MRRPPPLRTGRESFPSSGSSRYKAPRERSRFHDGCMPCCLYDTGLQPPDLAFRFGPVDLVPIWRSVRGRTHGGVHVHLLCLMRRFYRFSRNDRPYWKSARLRGGVMSALLSAPLQSGVGFLQRSVAPHLVSRPCGWPSSPRRSEGFTMFRSSSLG